VSRPLRILYANAWYHVMNRGASHSTTFHNSNDYKSFLDILLQIHRRYCFEIHAYCLMPNHYHLLVRTPLANLSRGMRHLDGLYTQYYNKKYKRDGSLFRGRYKAILIDAENYLLRLSRYIHLNPIKAKLAKHPFEYRWSSYRFYSKCITKPDWLFTNETLSRFDTKQQKNKYSLFVMGKTDHEIENFYQKTKLFPILGTDAFYKQISEKYLEKQPKKITIHANIYKQPELSQICDAVANYYHISVETLHLIDRVQGNQPRAVAIFLAAELSGKKFHAIADFFKNISPLGISKVIYRINKMKSCDPSLATVIENLYKII
jgi:putative transposase